MPELDEAVRDRVRVALGEGPPLGTATLGAGLWGQFDLAGEGWEWHLDWAPVN